VTGAAVIVVQRMTASERHKYRRCSGRLRIGDGE
jgi:hypothetical protein